jgi:recombination protein RecT
MTQALVKKPIDSLKSIVNSPTVKQQFENALKDNASLFTASLISLYGGDDYLQQCEASEVVQQALKAAVLKLPIEKSMGNAYIVPFKVKGKMTPTFILGYRGMLQLAMRTGQFKHINGDCIYEGESVETDRLTGEVKILGTPTSEKAIGYFAHMELITGFKKTVYWTKEKVIEHAKQHSKSYNSKYSAWATDFDAMAIKSPMRFLLSKYAPMSVEFINQSSSDDIQEDEKPEPIEINPKPKKTKKKTEKETIVDPQSDEMPSYMK